mmetsp:Transcript_90024/g.179005  ORF Transcript_90024/g.179005 Transcript_90024/m.179005 type:complete len:235 (+) Transcript_90024:1644-2348(+)
MPKSNCLAHLAPASSLNRCSGSFLSILRRSPCLQNSSIKYTLSFSSATSISWTTCTSELPLCAASLTLRIAEISASICFSMPRITNCWRRITFTAKHWCVSQCRTLKTSAKAPPPNVGDSGFSSYLPRQDAGSFSSGPWRSGRAVVTRDSDRRGLPERTWPTPTLVGLNSAGLAGRSGKASLHRCDSGEATTMDNGTVALRWRSAAGRDCEARTMLVCVAVMAAAVVVRHSDIA